MQRELPLKLRNVYAFFTIYANIDGFDPGDDGLPRRAAARRRARAGRSLDPLRAGAHDARVIRADGRLPGLRGDRGADRVRRRALELVRAPQPRALLGAGPRAGQARRPLDPLRVPRRWRSCWPPSCPLRPRRCGRTWCAVPSCGDGSEISVHLADYPEPDEAPSTRALSARWPTVRELVSLGLQVRTAKQAAGAPAAGGPRRSCWPDPDARGGAARARSADPRRAERARGALRPERRRLRHLPGEAELPRMLGPKVGKRMPTAEEGARRGRRRALLRELESRGRVERRGRRRGADALGPDEIAVSLEANEGFSAAAAGGVGVVVLGHDAQRRADRGGPLSERC